MQVFLPFAGGCLLFHLSRFFPFSAATLFVLTAIGLAARRRGGAILPLLFVLAGLIYGLLRFSPAPDAADLAKRTVRLYGRFSPAVSPWNEGAPRDFLIERAVDEETGEEIGDLGDEEIDLFTPVEPDEDERYDLLVRTGPDRTRLNPGAGSRTVPYGSVVSAQATGEMPASVVGWFGEQRSRLGRRLFEQFPGETASLLAAVTIGERGSLGEDLREAFNRSGLAHMLSISGTHFGMFSVFLFGLILFLVKRLPYRLLLHLTMYVSPRQTAAILSLPFMVLYLGLSGGSIPAVRAFVMIGLFLVGLLAGRQGAWLNSLLFAAFLLVLWDPGVLLSLSFQLSFLAVLFIGFSIGKEENGGEGGFLGRILKRPAVITLAAAAGTAPLVAYYFHYLSIISPVANLLVTPLIGFGLIPLSLVSSFVFLVSGTFPFGGVIDVIAGAAVAIVRFAGGLPIAAVSVPSFPAIVLPLFYAGFIPFLIRRRKAFLLVPLLPVVIAVMLGGLKKEELSVTFLDVGQGDSSVVEFGDGSTMVIDTGPSGREAAAYLNQAGKRDIDALVLTHAHPDHTGGIEFLLRRFRVGEIWDNGRIVYPESMSFSGAHRRLERGDVIGKGLHSMLVLHPYPGFYTLSGDEYDEENDASLVLRLETKGMSVLFTGDVGKEALEDLSGLGRFLKSDVLKVPHHGSRSSAEEGFFAGANPSVGVVSVGRGNAFGHPSGEVLALLERAEVFRTDRDGAVKVSVRDGSVEVKRYRDSLLLPTTTFREERQNLMRLFATW